MASSITRKEFLRVTVCFLGASAVACTGDDTGDDSAGDSGGCTGATASIDANHGHTLMIPMSDVMTGDAMTYDIMGTSTHTHEVTISAPNFAMLMSGGTIQTQSTTGGAHQHAVSVSCG